MTSIVNGASQVILHGTDDQAARQAVRTRPVKPSHMPVQYIFAARGPEEEISANPNDLVAMYGADTFDVNKPYYTHSTLFTQGFAAEGNAMRVKRLKPADAGPVANVFISIELIKQEIKDYERNTDGSIKVVAGVPVVKAPIQGYKARFIVSHASDAVAAATFGARTQTTGTWVDPAKPTNTSKIYPLWDLRESSFGADGNATGVSFYTVQGGGAGEQIDARLLSAVKAYPFIFKLLRANGANASSSVQPTLSGAQSVTMTFKKGVVNPYTRANMSVGDVLMPSYTRKNDTLLPDVPGNLGASHVYEDNVEEILGLLYAQEVAYIQASPDADAIITDFSLTGPEEKHLFNFFTGKSYRGYPYHTFQVEANADGFIPSSLNSVRFAGGSDGTMDDDTLNTLVQAELAKYLDRSSEVLNDAKYIQSCVWDSGYKLATKLKMLDVMAYRKDIAVALACFTHDNPKMTATEYNAMALTLKSAAQMYPESVQFGTACSRVFIMGGSGTVIGNPWKARTTCLYEVARKTARYMGAGDRKWKAGQRFAGYPGSIVNFMTDIDVTFVPVDQRVLDWNVGLNNVAQYDTETYYIPHFRTVYDNDTSVLNSWAVNMGIVTINKIIQETHRRFSGRDDVPNAVFKDEVERHMIKELTGLFDNRLLIQVEVVFTDEDIQRNFSWYTIVRIGANGTKTVSQAHIEAYRWEDLAAQIGA